MKNIIVLGGGFAGVWSAAAAVRAARVAGSAGDELRVTLISDNDDMVIRPRLYENDPQSMRVPLDRVLEPIGVSRVNARVNGIDVEERTVHALESNGVQSTFTYDRLVLATGSQLIRPSIDGAAELFDIDTLPAATALDEHLHQLPSRVPAPGQYTAVVVGAGFTGIEIATELGERLRGIAEPDGAAESVRVVLVERADVLGPDLGAAPRPHIAGALNELKVEVRLGCTVVSAAGQRVILSDGDVIPAATVIWTAGMTASALTAQIPAERDRFGRLLVDEYLRVEGLSDVYAAGDTAAALAEEGHSTIQSCQHAMPMGKCAGHNAATDLLGGAPTSFTCDPYGNALDLGSAGAITTSGWDRQVQLTGTEAKSMKQMVNATWIYPPMDSAEAILAQAAKLTNG